MAVWLIGSLLAVCCCQCCCVCMHWLTWLGSSWLVCLSDSTRNSKLLKVHYDFTVFGKNSTIHENQNITFSFFSVTFSASLLMTQILNAPIKLLKENPASSSRYWDYDIFTNSEYSALYKIRCTWLWPRALPDALEIGLDITQLYM